LVFSPGTGLRHDLVIGRHRAIDLLPDREVETVAISSDNISIEIGRDRSATYAEGIATGHRMPFRSLIAGICSKREGVQLS
jgi:hypothetical protein